MRSTEVRSDMEPPARRNRPRRWLVAAGLIGGFLVLDVLLPWGERRLPDLACVAMLGVCIAEFNLIAAWAALAPGNVFVRLPWSLLLTVLIWYALILGNRLVDPFDLDDACLLGTSLLGGAMVAQFPVWIAGRFFRWRLVLDEVGCERADGPGQFRIAHLLLGMLFLSIGLGLGRVILPAGEFTGIDLEDGGLPMIFTVVAAANLLITVPCIWGAFLRPRRLLVYAGGWLACLAAMTFLEYGALLAVLQDQIASDSLAQAMVVNVAQCATVILAMGLFRWAGLRLQRT
jgi:hypothetical protein